MSYVKWLGGLVRSGKIKVQYCVTDFAGFAFQQISGNMEWSSCKIVLRSLATDFGGFTFQQLELHVRYILKHKHKHKHKLKASYFYSCIAILHNN